MTPRRRAATFLAWFLMCLVLAMPVLALLPSKAEAHPLGNFTINHHSELEFSDGEARVNYILDFAEIPTVQEMSRLDTDDDGSLSKEEADTYLDAELPALTEGLRLEVGDEAPLLEIRDRSAKLVPGEAGLPTLRIEADLAADLPDGWEDDGAGYYAVRNYEDRLGWREVVVRGGPGVAVESSTAPTATVSDELRSYPEDMLSSPLDLREAKFALVPGDGSAEGLASGSVGGGAVGVADRLASLIPTGPLSPSLIMAALLSATLWGAAHALTPGHGKAVAAAYLVGVRGTVRHAGLLGLTVTLTHTAGVFVLGAVTIYLSRYILPETLYPWLRVASGLLVLIVGLSLLYNRLKKPTEPTDENAGPENAHAHSAHTHGGEHPHPHSHDHPRTHSRLAHSDGGDAHSHDHDDHGNSPTHSHHDYGSRSQAPSRFDHSDVGNAHGHDGRGDSHMRSHSAHHDSQSHAHSRFGHSDGGNGHSHDHDDRDHSHAHSHSAHSHHDHDSHDHSHAPSHSAHTHSHGGRAHSHLPPGADGSKVTVGSLLALGVTGGLVPCPGALVLLLGAISLGRLEFGLALVVAFSAGLAVVLTGIGILMVCARQLFERFSFEARVPRFLPVASAAAVSLVGAVILLGTLRQTGIF